MHFKGQTCIFHSLFKRLITLKGYSLYIFLLNILHFSSSIQPEKKKKLISKVFIDCIISLFISIIEKNHVNYINIFTYILQIVTDISFTWSFTNYPKPRGATTVIPRSRVLVGVRITTVLWTSVVIRLSWRPEGKGWGLSSREHFPSTLFAHISMIEPETDCCNHWILSLHVLGL